MSHNFFLNKKQLPKRINRLAYSLNSLKKLPQQAVHIVGWVVCWVVCLVVCWVVCWVVCCKNALCYTQEVKSAKCVLRRWLSSWHQSLKYLLQKVVHHVWLKVVHHVWLVGARVGVNNIGHCHYTVNSFLRSCVAVLGLAVLPWKPAGKVDQKLSNHTCHRVDHRRVVSGNQRRVHSWDALHQASKSLVIDAAEKVHACNSRKQRRIVAISTLQRN